MSQKVVEIGTNVLEGRNYKLVGNPKLSKEEQENPNNPWCVEIITGPYSGVIYQYGTASFQEEEVAAGEEASATMSFAFEVLQYPEAKFSSAPNESDEKFVDLIGEILMQILSEFVETVDLEQSLGGSSEPEIVSIKNQ